MPPHSTVIATSISIFNSLHIETLLRILEKKYLDSHVSGHDYAQILHSNQNFAHKKRFQSTELTPLIYLKKYTNLQWYSPLDPLAPSAAIANTY